MSDRVITAPLAIIKVNGSAIGKMKGIRVNEQLQRGEVYGLGSLIPEELPPLKWMGTLSCDFYNIDFRKSQIPGAIRRDVQTLTEWANNLLLQEDGVTVNIFTFKKSGVNARGLNEGDLQLYASIQGCFIDAENFDVNEGQVSGRNQSFKYLNPITIKS